jgi:hypothetical protein
MKEQLFYIMILSQFCGAQAFCKDEGDKNCRENDPKENNEVQNRSAYEDRGSYDMYDNASDHMLDGHFSTEAAR